MEVFMGWVVVDPSDRHQVGSARREKQPSIETALLPDIAVAPAEQRPVSAAAVEQLSVVRALAFEAKKCDGLAALSRRLPEGDIRYHLARAEVCADVSP